MTTDTPIPPVTPMTLFGEINTKDAAFNADRDHYTIRCTTCGAVVTVPSDVGLPTALCTARYAGWRRAGNGWRCPGCLRKDAK